MAFVSRLGTAVISMLLCGMLTVGTASGQGPGKKDQAGNKAGDTSKDKKDDNQGNKNKDDNQGNKNKNKDDDKPNKDANKGENKSAKGDNKGNEKKGGEEPRSSSNRGGQKQESTTSQQSSKNASESTGRRNSNTNNDKVSASVDKVRQDWRDRDRDKLPFKTGWWDNDRFGQLPAYNPLNSNTWRDRPYYAWQIASPDRISTFIVYGWKSPQYWDYGRGGNIYIEKDVVYRDGKRYKTADEYYESIFQLAHSGPKIGDDEAAQIEWMPFGVFAVVNENGGETGRVLQLAVNKNGKIAGAYFDKAEDRPHPVEGMVDEQTQTAAWALADGTSKELVMETGIYNLSEPQCTIMVHRGPQKAEVWQLVRLEQPASTNNKN